VVEKILSHSGAKTDSIFKIEWKSGDITWLPYYQITHLQALTDYLDLFRVNQINNLPKGTGKPPLEDPQIFLGAVSFISPSTSFSTSSFSTYFKCLFEIPSQITSPLIPGPSGKT
jgi:hypothetical protein